MNKQMAFATVPVPLSGWYNLAGMWNVDPPQGEKITNTDRDKSPNQNLNWVLCQLFSMLVYRVKFLVQNYDDVPYSPEFFVAESFESSFGTTSYSLFFEFLIIINFSLSSSFYAEWCPRIRKSEKCTYLVLMQTISRSRQDFQNALDTVWKVG